MVSTEFKGAGLHYTAFRDAIREDSRQITPSRGVSPRKKFAVKANVESRVNSGCKEYPTRFVSVEKARQLKSYSVESGDLVMSRKGDVGKCALFPTWYEPGIIHSDVVRVRVDRSQLDPLFMLHQFHLNDAVRKQILDVSNGSIMKGINVGKLKEINVFVPPLALQQQFVEIARKADETKAALKKSIADVDNIIKGLING